MALWLGQAMDVLKGGGMACLFSDWRQLPACTDALQIAGLVWRGIAVWDKINARPMPDRFRAQAEYIVWATNGPRDFDTASGEAGYHDGVFSIQAPPTSEREHSTQKPVELMERLVAIAHPGETVLDPFMGSGTTGCACARTGRRFIGMELTEHYFDIACKRISDAYKQPRLFEDKRPTPAQPQELPL
jgi:site-specific DNA-methyltransferase (adenine-specific)